MSTIAELTADRIVEGVYAVARKQRRTTRKGAPYLALELVDPTGRIEARIWNDVELLDGRFAEGDAVRVLGRVESFGNRLQLEIRSVEAADDDPAGLAPRMRRDADELDGFLEFLAAELVASRAGGGRRALPRRRRDPQGAARAAGRRDAPLLRRRPARAHGRRRHARARDRAAPPAPARPTCCSPRRCCTTSGASRELGRGPAFRPTEEGRLLGHVHLGLRLVEERAEALDADVRAELLHAIACHHDRNAARTAEAAVLYHANQLDAVAATRPVGD